MVVNYVPRASLIRISIFITKLALNTEAARSKSSGNEISLPSSAANGITLSSLAAIIPTPATSISYALWATSFFEDVANYKSASNTIHSLLTATRPRPRLRLCLPRASSNASNSLATLALSHNPRLQGG